MDRHLQFKRNTGVTYNSYDEAYSALTTDNKITSALTDGEQVFLRYKTTILGNTGHVQTLVAEKHDYTNGVENTAVTVDDAFYVMSPSALTVPVAFGDIEQGTVATSLNGKSLSWVLDQMLFKTIYPDITDPSIVLSAASTSATVQKGSALPELYVTYTRGKAVVQDGGVTPNKNYTGNLTGVSFYASYSAGTANTNAGVVASGTSFSNSLFSSGITSSAITTNVGGQDKVTGATTSYTMDAVGTYQFKATVSYAVGETLQTSKGDKPNPMRWATLNGTANASKAPYSSVTNPHVASTITSNFSITRNVTLPVYKKSGDETSVSAIALKSWGAMTWGTDGNQTSGILLAATEPAKPIVIKTPRKLSGFKGWDSTASKFAFDYLANFQLASATETINGVPYYVYTWNKGAVTYSNYYQIKTY